MPRLLTGTPLLQLHQRSAPPSLCALRFLCLSVKPPLHACPAPGPEGRLSRLWDELLKYFDATHEIAHLTSLIPCLSKGRAKGRALGHMAQMCVHRLPHSMVCTRAHCWMQSDCMRARP